MQTRLSWKRFSNTKDEKTKGDAKASGGDRAGKAIAKMAKVMEDNTQPMHLGALLPQQQTTTTTRNVKVMNGHGTTSTSTKGPEAETAGQALVLRKLGVEERAENFYRKR